MYLILVASGDSWGNYAYGEGIVDPADTLYFGFSCWAPDTTPNTTIEPYSLYACIDMDDNWSTNPYPDDGDYVIAGGPLSVSVLGGIPDYPVPGPPVDHYSIDNWVLVP